MTRNERTGWRDAELSLRHRLWGYNAPAVDIDWLVIEYDRAEPVVLIDYKESGSPRIIPNDANAMAFGRLGELAGKPAFVVRYTLNADGLYEFFLIPIPGNTFSGRVAPKNMRLDEIAYVRWLYEVRKRECPDDVVDQIEAQRKAT